MSEAVVWALTGGARHPGSEYAFFIWEDCWTALAWRHEEWQAVKWALRKHGSDEEAREHVLIAVERLEMEDEFRLSITPFMVEIRMQVAQDYVQDPKRGETLYDRVGQIAVDQALGMLSPGVA